MSSVSDTAPALRGGASGAASDAAPAAGAAAEGVRPSSLVLARVALGLLCVGFFWLQLIYIRHLPLVMDEMQGASAVYQLRTGIPYVDFVPYKNVLGYYLQLPPMLIFRGLWERMFAVKVEMALATAVGIYWAGTQVMRHLRPSAVVLATAALLSVGTFLERASELRVDMLTALAGLVSLALLLSQRFAWAGVAAGVSFLLSQKGIYYCVAGGGALFGYAFVVDRSRHSLRDAWKFSLAAGAVIFVYLAFFGLFGSFGSVAERALGVPAKIVMAEDYKNLRRFWTQSLERAPYFYAVAALGIGAALDGAFRERSYRDFIIFSYCGAVLAFCVWHKQPWPYFFVLLLPTLWLAVARCFDRLAPYGPVFWAFFLPLGVIIPLFTRVPVVLARSSDYQRYTIELAERLLTPKETYLAGMEMVYTRKQAPEALSWLGKTNLETVSHGGVRRHITALRTAPPKLVIWNYRIDALPGNLRRELNATYAHLWASVWLYCPTIREYKMRIFYDGEYQVIADGSLIVDEHVLSPGQKIGLAAGEHNVSMKGARLCLSVPPAFRRSLAPDYRKVQDLFPAIYDY